MKRKFWFAIPFIAAGIVALVGFVVMTLWNNLLPDILHVSTITFWQAIGIFVLCKILFGFGGKPGGRGGWGNKREKIAAAMSNMTPEEREKFKEKMENCGWGRRGFGRREQFGSNAGVDEENINPS